MTVARPEHAGMIASMPLPRDHWLYRRDPRHGFTPDQPPSPMMDEDSWPVVREALRWAIQASTMNGRVTDFDPDAMVQNLRIALYRAPELAHELQRRAYRAVRAGTAADYDLSIHANPDAMAWTKFFRTTNPDCNVPDDVMHGWFCNAMMAMHDSIEGPRAYERFRRANPDLGLRPGGEVASSWWGHLSPDQQAEYKKHHPRSRFNGHAHQRSYHVERSRRLTVQAEAHERKRGEKHRTAAHAFRDAARAHADAADAHQRAVGNPDASNEAHAHTLRARQVTQRVTRVLNPEYAAYLTEQECRDAAREKDRRYLTLYMLRGMLDAEQASTRWWDQMSARERQDYLRAHPRSKYAEADRAGGLHALQAHLRASGWRQRGATWTHPRTQRTLVVRRSGTAVHHLVVTHPNGDTTERPTNSLRTAKRVVTQMSRAVPSSTGFALKGDAGSLHRHLGVPRGRVIPENRLRQLALRDHPLARRAGLVLNLRRNRRRELQWA